MSKLVFLGFFDKCENIIKFWSKWQSFSTIGLSLALAPGALQEWVLFSFVTLYVLLNLIFTWIGCKKAVNIKRMLTKAHKLISKSKNKDLIIKFKKLPKTMFYIALFEPLFPILWPFTFFIKFSFYKHFLVMQDLMDVNRELLEE